MKNQNIEIKRHAKSGYHYQDKLNIKISKYQQQQISKYQNIKISTATNIRISEYQNKKAQAGALRYQLLLNSTAVTSADLCDLYPWITCKKDTALTIQIHVIQNWSLLSLSPQGPQVIKKVLSDQNIFDKSKHWLQHSKLKNTDMYRELYREV